MPQRLTKALFIAEVLGLVTLVLFFVEIKNKCCLLCEESLKQIQPLISFGASLEDNLTAIKDTLGNWRGIANMASFVQLGWGYGSRVDEMILARERGGFAGKK
ncbi:hypothetical protein Tco_1389546, partial [Tanacetum coccineum]